MMVRNVTVMYGLPDPLNILSNPPSKHCLKKIVKTAVTSFWHNELCKQASEKKSLAFLRCHFLPLGSSPHPLWTSCSRGSTSAVRSATVHAQLLCGSYRSDAVLAKWNGKSMACSLPGCKAPRGDAIHLLSGLCPALRQKLTLAISHGLTVLSNSSVFLHSQVLSALNRTPEDWLFFLLDPSTEPQIISFRQDNGVRSLDPIFRFSRTFIWTMHRERMRLSNQRHYLYM